MDQESSQSPGDEKRWDCHVCTFSNRLRSRKCSMCSTPRPSTTSSSQSSDVPDDTHEQSRASPRMGRRSSKKRTQLLVSPSDDESADTTTRSKRARQHVSYPGDKKKESDESGCDLKEDQESEDINALEEAVAGDTQILDQDIDEESIFDGSEEDGGKRPGNYDDDSDDSDFESIGAHRREQAKVTKQPRQQQHR